MNCFEIHYQYWKSIHAKKRKK